MLLALALFLYTPALLASSQRHLRHFQEGMFQKNDELSTHVKNIWKQKRIRHAPIPKCRAYVVKPPPLLDYKNPTYREILRHVLSSGIEDYQSNETFLKMLSNMTVDESDRIAYDSFTPPFYNSTTVALLQAAEIEIVLRAAPIPDLAQLNGVNIGAGGRPVPGTLSLDAHRNVDGQELPKAQQNVPNTWLSWADSLPFQRESLDFIVSMHNFEHLADPVKAMNHYLDLLKPGGGIGIVIPNYDYCWNAKNDNHVWGHRWSTTPEFVCRLYYQFWSDRADLVDIVLLEQRMTFGFILRKKGHFIPFDSNGVPSYETGMALNDNGKYIQRG
jgi:SAM-dependent methyltransferase